MRRVIKYGGTSLSTPRHFEKAARTIASLVEMGEQIAVVVSAMGNETSEILALSHQATGGTIDYKTQVALASMCEEKSVLLMSAALSSKKINAVPFYPRKVDTWPIIAESDDLSPLAAEKINEERDFVLRTQKTANRFNKYVLPLLRVGHVPVISGFIVLSSKDELVALGRGGSDITAFIVGRYIDCDEVVIVTDVAGVMSSDPKAVKKPLVFKTLSVQDVEAIAGTGGRVIHPRALKFKTQDMSVRIIDHKHQEELARTGTRIFGTSFAGIYKNEKTLAILFIMGSNWSHKPGILGRLSTILAQEGIAISSASANSRFISFYLNEDDAEEARRIIHSEVRKDRENFLGLNLVGGIGELRLSSSEFIDATGVLAEFTRVLAHRGINIVEVLTSATDIFIYVKYDKLEEAYRALYKLINQPR